MRYDRTLPLDRLCVEIHDEPLVSANRVKLQQVLINLLKNAEHAIHDRPDGRIQLSLQVEGDQAVLTVADNGCGMPPEVAAHIWEPFYSTKGEQGTGLGLDVAKSIVEGHGGTIECETAVDAGAKFTIRLPRLETAIQPPPTGTIAGMLFDALPGGTPAQGTS